jgi:general secretion pathway protein G
MTLVQHLPRASGLTLRRRGLPGHATEGIVKRSRDRARHETAGTRGFTVIELLIVIGILGVLVSLALGKYSDYRERIRVNQAVTEIGGLSVTISQYILENRSPPDSLADVRADGKLDPWGRPYQYFNLTSQKGNGKARKDKKLNPLNSDFDLYSMGKDGYSQSSLMAKTSRDDIIRARDGRFIGLAQDFDP